VDAGGDPASVTSTPGKIFSPKNISVQATSLEKTVVGQWPMPSNGADAVLLA